MTTSDLEALSRKYKLLLTLRDERARGEPPPPRSVFVALSKEFPGSLRELDKLPYDVLVSRVHALERAVGGAEPDPWMSYVAMLHHLVRIGLRARTSRRATEDALVEEASRHVARGMATTFVRDARGRAGPLRRLAVRVISEHHATTIESIAHALEPRFPGDIPRDRSDPSR